MISGRGRIASLADAMTDPLDSIPPLPPPPWLRERLLIWARSVLASVLTKTEEEEEEAKFVAPPGSPKHTGPDQPVPWPRCQHLLELRQGLLLWSFGRATLGEGRS